MNDTPAPLRISWSQLRAHAECKQKSHLLRGGHRNKAADVRNYFHGTVVDRIMRDWLANPHRSAGQMTTMVPAMIDAAERDAKTDNDGVVRWRSMTDRAELTDFCTTLLTRLEPILTQRVLPHRFDNGLRFTVPVTVPHPQHGPTTVHLTGELDLAVHHNTGTDIWDLKGTADDTYWRKVLGQLVFYDLALLGLGHGPSVRAGFIQPMCAQPVLEFTINDDQRRQMWAAIISMCEDIWAQHAPCRTDTSRCTYCEVRHGCPRFQPTALLASALRSAAP